MASTVGENMIGLFTTCPDCRDTFKVETVTPITLESGGFAIGDFEFGDFLHSLVPADWLDSRDDGRPSPNRILLVVLAATSIVMTCIPLGTRELSLEGVKQISNSIFGSVLPNSHNIGLLYFGGLLLAVSSLAQIVCVARRVPTILPFKLSYVSALGCVALVWYGWEQINAFNMFVWGRLVISNGSPPTRTVWVSFSTAFHLLLAITPIQFLTAYRARVL